MADGGPGLMPFRRRFIGVKAFPAGRPQGSPLRGAELKKSVPQIVRKNNAKFVIFSKILLDNLPLGWYHN